MLNFFAPRYLKDARIILKNARKLLHYKRDLLSEASLADFTAQIEKLEAAIKARDRRAIEEASQRLDAQWSSYLPPLQDAGWRENCEVFLVAIVIAIGVRTYFLQPFTIPTGSMQPTLNGLLGFPTAEPPPNPLRRVFDFAIFGRNYINVVAKTDEQIVALGERKFLLVFTIADIVCTQNVYHAWSSRETLERGFHVSPGKEYRAGEAIARGYINTGDHVFVDKVSYNFRPPQRGEVFVFKTSNIRYIEQQLAFERVEGSQFYIKRLAGLPDDELRVDSPNLYVNGERAQGFAFERVMAAEDGYKGYDQGPVRGYLHEPDQKFRLPDHSYFALGDNSYNSSDSRYWGTVPEQNIMGRGLFVYWPFASHWGFIR